MRSTTKLKKALEVTGQTFDLRLPNIVVYAACAVRGLEWNEHAEEWQSIRPTFDVELEIRISSYNPDDVISVSDELGKLYHANGHTVIVRQPVQRDSGVWQAYIRVNR